jgi:hypothetical protein
LTDLRIPPEHQRGLQKLYELSDESAAELLLSIQLAAGKEESDRLTLSTLSEIRGLPRKQEGEILDTISSLYRVRATADVSFEEFVSDICDSLRSPDSKDFRLPKEGVERFAKRLSKFLSVEALNRAVKATILRYEHERTLCSVRILTDARPVFGNDGVERPEAVVIFHMLKIAYHDSNNVREIYFSLDENDLQAVKKAVLRAELKSDSLRDALAAGKLKVITPAKE